MIKCTKALKLPTSSGNVGDGLPTSGPSYVEVAGLTGCETGGSAGVTVVLRQGGSTGPVVAAMALAANGGDTEPLTHPVRVALPLYCQLIGSGVFDGSAHIV